MASKIVFSPPLPTPIMDLGRALLPAGYDLHVVDQRSADFIATLEDAEYFMGFARDGLGSTFYDAAPRLKLVQLISAGYDRIDIEAARKAGVPVANNGGANSVAVSEAAVMLILATMKKLVWQHLNVVAGKWRIGDFAETRLYELAGKTVGIVGLGTIGKKVARRLRGFDVQILYSDVVRLTEDQEDALGVRFALLPELLRTSDVVTLHVPLNDVTRGMIGDRQFAMMKPTAVLVNTCRGPVVDEDALHRALTSKRIAGAGLDVMTEEPPRKDHPLFRLDNVTITPHTAGPTWENWAKAFRNGFDNIERVAAGGTALWIVPELRP